MDEKGLYELKTDIANLKKLHEQLGSLHRQQTEKGNQAKTNGSLTGKEIPGKMHEYASMFAEGIRNLTVEFSKRAQSIGDKIAACLDAAYYKESEIDQRIIALESKTSPYTLIDQTVAVLGLVREAQKYSLLTEITEGDYTDLLNLYRIALRNNNRTTLAFIEGRLEKLTREPGRNQEDEVAKKTLINLVGRSVAKRLDPKVRELREHFDAVINEHDSLIKDMDGDIKGPEAAPGHSFETSGGEQSPPLELMEQQPGPPQGPSDAQQVPPLAKEKESAGPPLEQAGQQEIPPLEPTEASADLPLDPLEQPSGLQMETPVETQPLNVETRKDEKDHQEVRVGSPDGTMADPEDLLLQACLDALDKRTGPQIPPLEQAREHPEPLSEQADLPLEPLEEIEDLPLDPLEQPSGLEMETPAEAVTPAAEAMKDRKDAPESHTELPDETMVDPGDLLLQAWTEALDKRPGPAAEGPEQQADPSREETQEHASPPLEHVGQPENPPAEPMEQQTDLPLEPLEEHADLALESLEQPSGPIMETPAETPQSPTEAVEDQKDAPESLKKSPDENIEDPGKMLIRAWMETLEHQPDAPLESLEEQPDPPSEQIGEGVDLPLASPEEQPEILTELQAETPQSSAETGEEQKDASEAPMESLDENTEDLGKILVQEWMKNLERKTEAPLEAPEEQTEVTMKASDETPEYIEETATDREDVTEPPMESSDENVEDLGKMLVQEWMKILDQKPATPRTLPEEQTEKPSGIPADELSLEEEKTEGTEYTTEPFPEEELETMDVSEALERICRIERTETVEKLKPMDLTVALERIATLEKSWPLEKTHARPAKTKTRKKTAPKKRKKSPAKKGTRKKAKK
ncbi:MAG: hypothetical protein ACMUIS_11025 [bacterium]